MHYPQMGSSSSSSSSLTRSWCQQSTCYNRYYKTCPCCQLLLCGKHLDDHQQEMKLKFLQLFRQLEQLECRLNDRRIKEDSTMKHRLYYEQLELRWQYDRKILLFEFKLKKIAQIIQQYTRDLKKY